MLKHTFLLFACLIESRQYSPLKATNRILKPRYDKLTEDMRVHWRNQGGL